ncbi:MAG: hypothetical protein CMO50_08095, partial [Verrucomicrobiales bacterium]|nr:hypothetical protein [Verrucomicrobiales bacterium]
CVSFMIGLIPNENHTIIQVSGFLIRQDGYCLIMNIRLNFLYYCFFIFIQASITFMFAENCEIYHSVLIYHGYIFYY